TACRTGALACGPPRRRDYFALGAEAKLVNAAYVLRILRYEMNHSREHLIGAADLETARRATIAASQPGEQRAEEIMQAQLKDLWLHTTGFTDRFAADAASVTTSDVESAAAAVFDPARLVLVAVVPNGQEFGTMLLSSQIQYQYPSTVDPKQIRRDDEPYLTQQQTWNPNYLRIVKASDLFR
ncbi:MAG: hypothetical protein HY304_04600, partial [candidate division Zixibacteria bacterium]|nr:hypothetical protein [candidate division Zixibacteria bacterium]